MDVSKMLAAAPFLRRAWRALPGPLRIPVVVVAAIVWFVRRRGEGDAAEPDVPAGGSPAPEEPSAG